MAQKKLIQTSLDFASVPHARENNQFSQAHLDKHRHKFRGQAALILSELQKGVKLTDDYARDIHGIRRLGARIHDLGDGCNHGSEFGLDIDREYMLDKDLSQVDILVYFFPEFRKEFAAKKWIIDRPRWWFSEKYTHPDIIKEILKNKNTKQ